MEKEDIQLIRAAKNGSSEAFTLLVGNYKDFVFRNAMGILQNRMDAEDVVQEVFVKAFLSFRQLQDERAFPSWLATITTRQSLDLIKKRKSARPVSLDEEHAYALSQRDIADESDARVTLYQSLSELSPEHRAVLILREIQGFDYQEIARILEIPMGTVRSRLHAARLHLRNSLCKREKGEM